MDTDARHFISTWAVTCGAIVVLVGTFNIMVDPYRMLGWNSLKPAAIGNERLLKAYEAVHVTPNSLLLGSSRIDFGLNARHPTWPTPLRPVYNLGMLGAGPYLSYRYLQHVLSGRPVKLIVMGLDFDSFLALPGDVTSVEPEVDSRLKVRSDGSSNSPRAYAFARDILRSLSLDELVDSVTTVAANVNDDSSDYVSGSWVFNRRGLREISARGATLTFAVDDLLESAAIIQNFPHVGARLDPRVMRELSDILNLCDSRGTRVILFINPVHADLLEIWDSAGLWPRFEDWKRQLTALTHEYSQAHVRSQISLWDFSGYHSYATEAVRSTSRQLDGYFDPSHYTWAVGDIIIRQILGQSVARLGTELTPWNVESHLASLRQEQQEYHTRQPLDVERVRILYKGLLASAKRRAAAP